MRIEVSGICPHCNEQYNNIPVSLNDFSVWEDYDNFYSVTRISLFFNCPNCHIEIEEPDGE